MESLGDQTANIEPGIFVESLTSNSDNSSRDLIQGVGNEVLVTAIVIATSSLVLVLLVARKHLRSHAIHPSHQDAVNTARERLNIVFSNRFLESQASAPPETPAAGEPTSAIGDTSQPRVVNSNHYGMDNLCPVCLNEPQLPVETNCGHLFCSQCLVIYWRHGHWASTGALRCPVCRQQVTVMLTCFRLEGRPSDPTEDVQRRQQALRDINDYNRRYSGAPRPWIDYLRDLPTLLRHLSSEFFTLGGLMYMLRIRIILCFVAAVMYLISPLDMIPEAVFGLLGLLDDIFVVILLAVYVTIIYRRFLADRWTNDTPEE